MSDDDWPITKTVPREDYEAVVGELQHCRMVEIPDQDEKIKNLTTEIELRDKRYQKLLDDTLALRYNSDVCDQALDKVKALTAENEVLKNWKEKANSVMLDKIELTAEIERKDKLIGEVGNVLTKLAEDFNGSNNERTYEEASVWLEDAPSEIDEALTKLKEAPVMSEELLRLKKEMEGLRQLCVQQSDALNKAPYFKSRLKDQQQKIDEVIEILDNPYKISVLKVSEALSKLKGE